MTDGVTEKANESQLLDSGLSAWASMLENPQYYYSWNMMGKWGLVPSELSWCYASKKSF